MAFDGALRIGDLVTYPGDPAGRTARIVGWGEPHPYHAHIRVAVLGLPGHNRFLERSLTLAEPSAGETTEP